MKKVNGKDFEQEVLQSALPVLVDFYADWCGPCRMLGSIIHQLAEEYEGKIKVVQVNVDQSPDLAAAFRVASIPTLLFFRGGQIKGSYTGFCEKEDLEQKLHTWEAL